jgi:formylglycine-generating enzyme required for sulfatase activity
VVRLPSEAEWEKAACGGLPSPSEGEGLGARVETRIYPWGDDWDETRCNTSELGLGGTTPVGIFPEGASPYGCLDMAGNVWEWTGSHYKEYPYDRADGRENLEAGDDVSRVLRGGSWLDYRIYARCAYRDGLIPDGRWDYYGFRIVVSPISPNSALPGPPARTG